MAPPKVVQWHLLNQRPRVSSCSRAEGRNFEPTWKEWRAMSIGPLISIITVFILGYLGAQISSAGPQGAGKPHAPISTRPRLVFSWVATRVTKGQLKEQTLAPTAVEGKHPRRVHPASPTPSVLGCGHMVQSLPLGSHAFVLCVSSSVSLRTRQV